MDSERGPAIVRPTRGRQREAKGETTTEAILCYTQTSPDRRSIPKSNWLYDLQSKMEKLYIQSAKTRPGTDCGSDHEHLVAKFRLKLKKVGKTTRPFRYDLNQIPYNYTLKVTNRFKGLDLIDRVPE